MVKGMIGPDTIVKAIEGAQNMAAEHIAEASIDPAAGETGSIVFYQVGPVWFFAVEILNADNVARRENVQPLEEFIENLIKQF